MLILVGGQENYVYQSVHNTLTYNGRKFHRNRKETLGENQQFVKGVLPPIESDKKILIGGRTQNFKEMLNKIYL